MFLLICQNTLKIIFYYKIRIPAVSCFIIQRFVNKYPDLWLSQPQDNLDFFFPPQAHIPPVGELKSHLYRTQSVSCKIMQIEPLLSVIRGGCVFFPFWRGRCGGGDGVVVVGVKWRGEASTLLLKDRHYGYFGQFCTSWETPPSLASHLN